MNVVAVGGDFGGKGDARDLPVAYLLAKMAQRPVKIVMSYGEELTASNPASNRCHDSFGRDPRRASDRSRGANGPRQWRLWGHEAQVISLHLPLRGRGLQRPQHVFRISPGVYQYHTGGYFRAPGARNTPLPSRCHTDLLAQALGMDPAAFRRKNLVGPGEEDAGAPSGWRMSGRC